MSENGTAAEIKPAVERLQEASYKMAELLYKATTPEQGAPTNGASNGATNGATENAAPEEDVIDAEFKEAK